jgi:hypothetical protein
MGAVHGLNYAHIFSEEKPLLLHRTHLLKFLSGNVFGSLTQSE